jgi:uncharacterized membrane protein
VLAVFVGASVLYTWPLASSLATDLPTIDDSLLNSWILAWDIHALTTNALHLFDANIFFPFPLPLTYSDTLLTGAIVVAPVLMLTGNPVLAHNALALACLSLAGFGMYVLARELTGNELGAFVGGCIYAFTPYVQGQLGHVQLLQTGWLPLALLFLHRALRGGKTRDYALFTLFCICEAWASFYLLVIGALVVGAFLAFEAGSNRTTYRISSLIRLAGSLALIGVFVVPLALPYRQSQQTGVAPVRRTVLIESVRRLV